MSGVDREDRGARKRREAEGEGGSRWPEESERARAGLARVRVAGERGGGGARGRELSKGEGRRSGGRVPARTGAVRTEERIKVNLAPPAFGMGKEQRGRSRAPRI